MIRQSDTEPAFSIANLSEAERHLLTLVHDEEQRSVLYRELLRKNDIDPPGNLSVAENVLIYQYMLDNLFSKLPTFPEEYIRYVPAYGRSDLRENMAARLGQTFGAPVKEEEVFGTAGVASALQSIVLALQQAQGPDPVPVPAGSTVLLPAPFWQGFHWSFEQTAKLRCVPVNLTTKGVEAFQLTLEDLQRTYAVTEPKPKLLVLTNPHNPLGVNYDPSLLESIYEWALLDTEMHVISDEMYCHSQLHGAKPAFVSALKLRATELAPDRVHVAWGFAKDFGLSGFRAGFVISKSKYVQTAMTSHNDLQNSLSWFTPFDTLKHRHILPIVKEGGIWDGAMKLYQTKLSESFDAVAEVLTVQQIPFVHPKDANSAQFFWLDLRTFLTSCTFDSEKELQEDIQHGAGVLLLSGKSLTCPVPGYFRLCFTAYEKDEVVQAVGDVCSYLRSRFKKL